LPAGHGRSRRPRAGAGDDDIAFLGAFEDFGGEAVGNADVNLDGLQFDAGRLTSCRGGQIDIAVGWQFARALAHAAGPPSPPGPPPRPPLRILSATTTPPNPRPPPAGVRIGRAFSRSSSMVFFSSASILHRRFCRNVRELACGVFGQGGRKGRRRRGAGAWRA